jgi:hypothetical protein
MNYYNGTQSMKAQKGALITWGFWLNVYSGSRMPGLLGFDMVCFFRPSSYSLSHLCTLSDAPRNIVMHTAFLILFFVFVFALLRMEFCDPGICASRTKGDALKPVREVFSIRVSRDFIKAVVYTWIPI